MPQRHFSRSLSVPDKARSIRKMDSLGGVFRVIPTTPQVAEGSGNMSDIFTTEQAENNDAEGEDIPEEEAAARENFCYLEQLLVSKMKTGAIAISLPFSCILGLLASMTASTMVQRKYVWVYATIQFVLVVLFAHIFYSVLHVQSVLSIIVSTFAGFGMAMSGSSIIVEFLRWRRRWLAWSDRCRASQESQQPPDRPLEGEHPPPQTVAHPGHQEANSSQFTRELISSY